MSSHHLPIVSEDELHAFVDGQLDPRRREAIAQHLQILKVEAAKVETWQEQNRILRAAFASIEAEAIPLSQAQLQDGPKQNFLIRQQVVPKGLRRACLLCASFACGAFIAFIGTYSFHRFTGMASEPVLNERIEDQAFALRTMTALQAFSQKRATNPDAARNVPKTSLILPSLAEDNFALAGMRIFPSEAQAQMACLFYAKASSPPITLCVEAAGDDDLSLNSFGTFPKTTIYWRQKHARYALNGPMPEADLRNLTKQIQTRIASFDPPPSF